METWSESGLPQLLHDEKSKLLALDKKSQDDSRKNLPNFFQILDNIPVDDQFVTKFNEAVKKHNDVINKKNQGSQKTIPR